MPVHQALWAALATLLYRRFRLHFLLMFCVTSYMGVGMAVIDVIAGVAGISGKTLWWFSVPTYLSIAVLESAAVVMALSFMRRNVGESGSVHDVQE